MEDIVVAITPSSSWVGLSVTSSQIVELTALDRFMPNLWNPHTFFFSVPDSGRHWDVYCNLKEGLRRTLADISLLGGRLHSDSQNPKRLFVSIDETGGAEFGYESHRLLDIADSKEQHKFPDYATLRAGGFPQKLICRKGAPRLILSPATQGSPVFAAQFNSLSGGIAITFGIHHSIADAEAWSGVVELWSWHTARVSRGVPARQPADIHFDELRGRIDRGSPGLSEATLNSRLWKLGERPTSNFLRSLSEEVDEGSHQPELSTWRIWYFSPDRLAQLKRDAQPASIADWVSTLDALSALLWHRTSVHRMMNAKGYELSSCRITINVRRYLDVPANNSAERRVSLENHSNEDETVNDVIKNISVVNCVQSINVESPLSLLEQELTPHPALATYQMLQPLSNVALKVRRAISSWSLSSFDSWIGLHHSLHPDRTIQYATRSAFDPNILINDHSKLRVYDFDWGKDLGRVERIRKVEPGPPVGVHLGFFMPRFCSSEGGGFEVATLLDEETNWRMERDEVWLSYAELVCV